MMGIPCADSIFSAPKRTRRVWRSSVTAAIMVGCPRCVTMKVKFELAPVMTFPWLMVRVGVTGDDSKYSFIVTLFRVLGYRSKICCCKKDIWSCESRHVHNCHDYWQIFNSVIWFILKQMVVEIGQSWGFGRGKDVWLEIRHNTLSKSLLRDVYFRSTDQLIVMPIYEDSFSWYCMSV